MTSKESLYEEYKFYCYQANSIYPEIYTAAMQGSSISSLINMLLSQQAYGTVLSDFLTNVEQCKEKRKQMTETYYRSKADTGHKLPVTRSKNLIKAIRDYKDYALQKLEKVDYKVGQIPCLSFREMMLTWNHKEGSRAAIKANIDGTMVIGKFSSHADMIYRNDQLIQWPLPILKRMMEIVCTLKLTENMSWKDVARTWSDETTKPYIHIYAKVDSEELLADINNLIPYSLFDEQDLVWISLMFIAQIKQWTI